MIREQSDPKTDVVDIMEADMKHSARTLANFNLPAMMRFE